jgi:hypothetical protein
MTLTLSQLLIMYAGIHTRPKKQGTLIQSRTVWVCWVSIRYTLLGLWVLLMGERVLILMGSPGHLARAEQQHSRICTCAGVIVGNGLVDVVASFDTVYRMYVRYSPSSVKSSHTHVFKLFQCRQPNCDVELSIQVLTLLALHLVDLP